LRMKRSPSWDRGIPSDRGLIAVFRPALSSNSWAGEKMFHYGRGLARAAVG
jgi:hypothetical protein